MSPIMLLLISIWITVMMAQSGYGYPFTKHLVSRSNYEQQPLMSCSQFLSSQSDASSSTLGFDSPFIKGGSMLFNASHTDPPTVGEPLNVIISANSDPEILTRRGFLDYAIAIGFSWECMGLHLGPPMQADVGDGAGWVDQVREFRQHYDNILFGSCIQTLVGGNHFRLWQQETTKAIFLAASLELSARDKHVIAVNGYDEGRDALVAAATANPPPKGLMGSFSYSTTVQYVDGLLPIGVQGLNHAVAIDGRVAVLTVRRQTCSN